MPRKPFLVAVLSTLLCLVGVGPTAASDHPGSDSRHGPPTNGPIAFGRVDLAIGGPSLWTSNADGSHQVRLTTDVTGFSDWSPDGRRIAFDFADDSGVHIATISPDGRHRRSLTTTLGVQEVPRWSPDGTKIAFDAFEFDQEPFSISIRVMRADGSHQRQLTHGAIDVEPVFSPDGTKIAFGRIVGDSPTGQLEAIYVIHADGSGLREVVPARAGLEHPDWSPDGRQITFNIAPENPDAADSGAILSVRPNGRGLRVMYPPTRELRFFKAVWSPDGREILSGCHDTRVGLDRICRISGRGKTRVVVSGDTDVNFPSWGAQARPRH
jgi:Tol biopolymer transport system component